MRRVRHDVLIDPDTRLPPDVGNTDPARASREPLCDDCIDRVEADRRARGLPRAWPRHTRDHRPRP